ncbi:hypothetical protein [Chishuiella sp.]|uniref:hypothetical protein n=1 Tax=Chishuiella sp. TaxID=1969467 RepID=UPI0028B010B2|nr:hypothetical protein [Chishuiella sp.]
MKKIIIVALAIFSLQSCISVRVNADVDSRASFSNAETPNITAEGTFFENGVKDSKWSNSNGSNWTKAKFENATGTTYIKLKTKKSLKVDFRSVIHIEGDLAFEIIDANKAVLYASNAETEEGRFSVNFPKEGEYQIRWKSTSATGNYFLEWKEK